MYDKMIKNKNDNYHIVIKKLSSRLSERVNRTDRRHTKL